MQKKLKTSLSPDYISLSSSVLWVAFDELPHSDIKSVCQSSKSISINHPLLRIDFMGEPEKERAYKIEKARDMLLYLLKNGQLVVEARSQGREEYSSIPQSIWNDCEIDWDDNCIEDKPEYIDIRIKTSDLSSLFTTDDETAVRNIPNYTTPYLDLMLKAIVDLNISPTYQPTKEVIISYLKEQMPELSANLANYMATFIRLPDAQKGGYWKPTADNS